MEPIEGFNGAILRNDPRDYKLGSTSIEIPDAFNLATHEYNQLEYGKVLGTNLCTAYAPIGMLSDLIGREITGAEREEIAILRTNMYDFDPAIGGYLVEGNNCVRNWWNKANPDNQIRQFALNNDQLLEALEKGHRVNIGYRGNRAYNDDAGDGVLDSVEIGDTSYGHSTTCKIIEGKVIVDSYLGVKKYNIYKIADFKEFIDSEITFLTSYLYLFTNESMESEIQLLKQKHKDSGVTFNEDKIREYREFFNKK